MRLGGGGGGGVLPGVLFMEDLRTGNHLNYKKKIQDKV